jgi:hypothetical protein
MAIVDLAYPTPNPSQCWARPGLPGLVFAKKRTLECGEIGCRQIRVPFLITGFMTFL